MTDPIQNLIDVAKTQLCRSDCLEPGVGCCKPNLVEAIRAARHNCPICGEGNVTLYMMENEKIPCFYHKCDACGAEHAGAELSRINKQIAQFFKGCTNERKPEAL